MDKEILIRIATALEKIADALTESKPKEIAGPRATASPRVVLPATKKPAGEVHYLIGVYISAYQLRYGKNARPDVGGKVQGQMKNLLKDHPAQRLVVLIQAFLQMDDDWFKTKCHDFPTFYENLGKVQTAFRNGTPRAEDKRYWGKVFGGDNDARNFSDAGTAIASELPRGQLQRGAGSPLLEGPKDDA